jgi:hypothetical protein
MRAVGLDILIREDELQSTDCRKGDRVAWHSTAEIRPDSISFMWHDISCWHCGETLLDGRVADHHISTRRCGTYRSRIRRNALSFFEWVFDPSLKDYLPRQIAPCISEWCRIWYVRFISCSISGGIHGGTEGPKSWCWIVEKWDQTALTNLTKWCRWRSCCWLEKVSRDGVKWSDQVKEVARAAHIARISHRLLTRRTIVARDRKSRKISISQRLSILVSPMVEFRELVQDCNNVGHTRENQSTNFLVNLTLFKIYWP